MRKLADIKGADGIAVLGTMLPTIEKMVKANGEKANRGTLEYIGDMLKNSPNEAIELLAVIDGKPIEEYSEKSFIDIMADFTAMVQDEDVMRLFNTQR